MTGSRVHSSTSGNIPIISNLFGKSNYSRNIALLAVTGADLVRVLSEEQCDGEGDHNDDCLETRRQKQAAICISRLG